MSVSRSRRVLVLLAELAAAAAVAIAGAAALTWPAILHLDEVVVGGGELGGWLWRYWWHFLEVDGITHAGLGPLEQLRAFISLGRFPETGNILDVLLLSYPLQRFVGFPAHYDAKVFIILLGDGLCGYALARHFIGSRSACLAASLLAVVNPLVVQDLTGSGLRQVLLWWLLLFPALLDRAARLRRPASGALAGACLGIAGAFYWFYGLFCAVFLLLWLVDLLLLRRSTLSLRRTAAWLLPLLLVAGAIGAVFAIPYLPGSTGGGHVGAGSTLPELTWFLPFPPYDAIKAAPLRPSTYAENVLSSLHRTIASSWSADYPVNPANPRALSLVVLLAGVLPAIFRSRGAFARARFWLVVFAVFYLGTLGPYLKTSAERDATEVLVLADQWVVRMPYAWMFRWIPGMSRMFAPYRMGSFVAVASVVLVAFGLGGVPNLRLGGPWPRRLLGLAAIAATLALALRRFEVGPVPEGSFQPTRWRAPVRVSAIRVPAFYRGLDPEAMAGIVELPLDEEQDMLALYQVVHHWKVYRSWATPPAIPPALREEGGGEAGERLRFLASQDLAGGPAGDALARLSRAPQDVDLDQVPDAALLQLLEAGSYRYVVVHERGYYLVDPHQGPILYQDAVQRLSRRLGVEPEESVEHQWFDYPGNEYTVPGGPVYIPWSAQAVQLPDDEMPSRYFMAVFDLSRWIEERSGAPSGTPDPGPAGPPP